MARIYVPSTPATRGETTGPQRGETNRQSGLTLDELREAANAAGFDLAPRLSEPTVDADEPAGNATTEEWTAYAKAKGATDEDLVDEHGKPLGQRALREKYSAPTTPS